MREDERCCGSGTCIIDAEGRCWCGQQWDGEKMAAPVRAGAASNPGGTGCRPPETDASADVP